MAGENELYRVYYDKASPYLPELYHTAFAICGNAELAEYCLQYALTQHYTEGSRTGASFRDGLRSALRNVSLEEALASSGNDGEGAWDGLSYGGTDPILGILAAEDRDTRRVIALICGCGLSQVRTAKLMRIPQAQVRVKLESVEKRIAKTLRLADARKVRQQLVVVVRKAFQQEDATMPSRASLYRAFAGEISEEKPSRHILSRALRTAMAAVMIAVCIALVWLAAVLIQPEQVELEEGTTITQEQP